MPPSYPALTKLLKLGVVSLRTRLVSNSPLSTLPHCARCLLSPEGLGAEAAGAWLRLSPTSLCNPGQAPHCPLICGPLNKQRLSP